MVIGRVGPDGTVGHRVAMVLACLPPRHDAGIAVLPVGNRHRPIVVVETDAEPLPVALVVEEVGRPGRVVEA
jgi:hypothetical protein